MTKRTGPEVRAAILVVADCINDTDLADELRGLVAELVRESPSRKRAPVKHAPLTPQVKQRIVACARGNPKWHLADIAAHFNTNPGRVSEALREAKNNA
jgi:hypothetical protein